MRVALARTSGGQWRGAPFDDAHLVLAFGSRRRLPSAVNELTAAYPEASVVSASSAGHILGRCVLDDEVVGVALRFDSTVVAATSLDVTSAADSARAGREIAARLTTRHLVHLLVLADGLNVNGSELVRGLTEAAGVGVTVTGGLAADGEAFQRTLVGVGASPRSGQVAAVGFYGERFRVGCGWGGGWDPFGPDRVVTRSTANRLSELDGEAALDLYERYLGEEASRLPAAALRFPLALYDAGTQGVVRTILGVDRGRRELVFAGDVPQGTVVRLMKANVDRLVDGAAGAARRALETGLESPALALAVSCVGRRMLMRQRVEEELDAVAEVLAQTPVVGFYSYGELAPTQGVGSAGALHNQTMTVTTFGECPL